jgi:hypothetical protein
VCFDNEPRSGERVLGNLSHLTALRLQATSNPGLCPGLRSAAALRLQKEGIFEKTPFKVSVL